MRVLVRVDVRDAHSCGLQFANLGTGFGFNFAGGDAAGDHAGEKAGEAGFEFSAGGVGEIGNFARIECWTSVDEEHVASDGQSRGGESDGVGEGRSCCHQRGRRDYALRVRLHDGAIHACGEAKIIGVDD